MANRYDVKLKAVVPSVVNTNLPVK